MFVMVVVMSQIAVAVVKSCTNDMNDVKNNDSFAYEAYYNITTFLKFCKKSNLQYKSRTFSVDFVQHHTI